MTTMQSAEVRIKGKPICRGIAIGKPFNYFIPDADMISEETLDVSLLEDEVVRYQVALKGAVDEIIRLQALMEREDVFEGAAILDGHLQMMQDSLLTIHVEERIRKHKKNAEYVFQSIIVECAERFNSMNDSFFRERFKDLQEISKRVHAHLRKADRPSIEQIPKGAIIFAKDLTAEDTVEASTRSVSGFVTREGGSTSHAAIVAKAKGLPFVTSVDVESLSFPPDTYVIVDGRTGEIIINPDPETLDKYKNLCVQLQEHLNHLCKTAKLGSETYDGYCVHLAANVEDLSDVEFIHQAGCSTVGLVRTESPFLSRNTFPDEEEQFFTYSRLVKSMKGGGVVFRAFDIGGDKFFKIPFGPEGAAAESNPFLGCRGIRYLLNNVGVFKTQLRALLRASVFGNIKIMFPMISSLEELLAAKCILEEVKKELLAEGHSPLPKIPLGCMIEVPSSAMTADLILRECDFLSIGTNDLVQYTLAVDRTNTALSQLYNPSEPSVLRMIRLVVNEANLQGKSVSICGEVASDPRYTSLLLGLGVHELSVAARYLPVIKNAIRRISIIASTRLAENALRLATAKEVDELLTREYQRTAPEDCFYNC